LLIRVTVNLCNSYESVGQLAASASTAQEVYAVMRERGSAQGMSCIGARAAMPMINLGQWDSARSIIRETLALRLSTRWGAAARCGAALLCALKGDVAEANSHISRARELMPLSELGGELMHSEMTLATEVGAPGRTLDLVESHMSAAVALGHLAADELLQLAARAAADLAEGAASTSGEARISAMSQLERIEALRGGSPPPFVVAGPQDALHPAWGALYAADRARCFAGDRPLVQLWQSAAEATERAGLRFEQARSLYFLGRSLLAEPKGRDKAAEALAGAAGIAQELHAAPLATLVEQLALQAHIALAVPGHQESTGSPPIVELGGVALTPREAEVLDHLVAGETYAQVARGMFISEKTVSAHVSNLLRKTGTSSRIELAALAIRSKVGPGERDGTAT
jgi:DNA-binding CsgD family transcriptional regulator